MAFVMTIFPEHPYLESAAPKDGQEMRRLVEDHVTFIKFRFWWSLMVIVKAGYETDGATVALSKDVIGSSKVWEQIQEIILKYFPSANVKDIYEKLVGTPWDVPRLLAAVVHDALYSLKWHCRFICDRVYKKILCETNYDTIRREIEYNIIRLVGWKNWEKVSKEERELTRKFVVTKWVRTRKIPSIIKNLRKSKKR